MDNLAISQQVKVFLLSAAGMLLAIYLGMKIGSEEYQPLILGTLILVVGAFALFSGRFFWVVTVASSALAGTFPILGGSFTPFQILMGIGVAKFLIEDVVLRRTRIKTGDRIDLFLIAGFMAILTWHGVHDRFGMKFLGSNVWGGRYYVSIYVALAAFFIIQSIPMPPKVWRKLPYLLLAVASFDLLVALITTIFPASIYAIYPFYSAVSRTGVEEIVGGVRFEETARLGSAGGFGITVIILVLASTSLRRLLHLSSLFRVVTLAMGFLAVLLSSFRSAVFNVLAVVLVAGIRDLRWGVVALLPAAALFLFGLSVINSAVVPLPKPIQRSLTFVPGHWDANMSRGAASSNEWRGLIWSQFLQDYFPRHPWLGRGFGFQSQWATPSVHRYDPEENRKQIEVGNIHNGSLAALDTFGIIGTIFFAIWNLRLLARTLRVPLRRDDPTGLALPFLALSFGSSIICYWMSASNIGGFLPVEFALAGVFLRLLREREAREANASARLSPAPVKAHGVLVAQSAQGAE